MRRYIVLIPLVLSLAACGTFTEQPEDIGGSPFMRDVAKGAIVEISETIDTSGPEVIFKKGRIQGWFNYDTWTYDCRL